MKHTITSGSLLSAAGIAILLAACKGDTVTPMDPGHDYFPTAIGTWVEYQVDSMWRDDELKIHDSISYRLLERIEEHYIDPAGRPAQRILRYVRNEQGDWQVRDVWMSTRSERYAEKLEEDIRRLKLSFPLREGRAWDINVYNTEDELPVALSEVDVPASVGDLAFDSTAAYANTIPANLVDRRDYRARYARNVGMVSQDWEETDTQTTFPPGGGVVIKVKGFRLRMEAVAYGSQ